jgi:hypothetical protein
MGALNSCSDPNRNMLSDHDAALEQQPLDHLADIEPLVLLASCTPSATFSKSQNRAMPLVTSVDSAWRSRSSGYKQERDEAG